MENPKVTKLSSDDLQIMSTFEKMTHSKVEDYLNDADSLYFIVTTDNFRALVGKNGENIKRMEKGFGKKIKVFRFTKDLKEFIMNLTLQTATQIEANEDDKTVQIRVPEDKKAVLIGRSGNNINAIKTILARQFGIKKVMIK